MAMSIISPACTVVSRLAALSVLAHAVGVSNMRDEHESSLTD